MLSYLVCSSVRVAHSYVFCVVCCDPLFVLGFVLLNLIFSRSICLVCGKLRVVQFHVFCVVFCDPLFEVGFVLLNLMFSV